MALTRSLKAVFFLVVAAAVAAGQPVELAAKMHTETWYFRRGGICKQFEWTLTPVVSGASVHVRESCRRTVDKFAGVAGEIGFAGTENALQSVEVVFADGSRAEGARGASVSLGSGQVAVLITHHEAQERRWTLTWRFLPVMSDEGRTRAEALAGRLADAPRPARIRLLREFGEAVATLEEEAPEIGLATAAGKARLESEAALEELRRVLDALAAGSVSRDDALAAAARLVERLERLQATTAEQPALLHDLATALQRLDKVGLAVDEYLRGVGGGASPALAFIDQAMNVLKAGSTAAELAEDGQMEAERFVSDTLSVVPVAAAPALKSPAGVFFRDLMAWNQDMWSASTDGLNIVADAIETGRVDTGRLDRATRRLDDLGRRGPSSLQSGVDFLKKTAEGLPVVGKLLGALWG